MKELIAILARADDGTIGIDGKLPWSIKEDMHRFKRLTSTHQVIMGRKTFDSIGRPLPNRRNLVVGSLFTGALATKDIETFALPEDALYAAWELPLTRHVYLIGGALMYESLWPYVTRIELTEVHRSFPDAPKRTLFTMNVHDGFDEIDRQRAETEPDVYFTTLVRRKR